MLGMTIASILALSALVLRAAHALQIGGGLRDTTVRTAYCVVGCARTFTKPQVEGSLGTYLQALGAAGIRGLQDPEKPDIFAYIITDDDTSYGREHVVNDAATVHATLTKHGVTGYKLDGSKGDVEVGNIDSFVSSKQCLTAEGSFFALNDENLARALNQVAHIQECVKLVQDGESKANEKYDAVVITRPDLEYSVPDGGIPSNFFQPVLEGGAMHDRDLWFAMPRDVAFKLIPSEKIVGCSPGEMCCGRIGKVEELFEYKLGFVVAASGSCKCTKESIPQISVKHWIISGDAYGGHW